MITPAVKDWFTIAEALNHAAFLFKNSNYKKTYPKKYGRHEIVAHWSLFLSCINAYYKDHDDLAKFVRERFKGEIGELRARICLDIMSDFAERAMQSKAAKALDMIERENIELFIKFVPVFVNTFATSVPGIKTEQEAMQQVPANK